MQRLRRYPVWITGMLALGACGAPPAEGTGEEPAGLVSPICPGSGFYCGNDGMKNGAANTVYGCSGAGAAATSAQVCSAGCSSQPAGTDDYCNCFTRGSVPGIDVSVFQGSVDWRAVAASGIGFAFARVGEGTVLDTEFAANWQGMKGAGLIRGVYQYFYGGVDGTDQANFLLGHIGKLGPADLPPVLDVEAQDNTSFSGATISAGVAAWRVRVKAAIGREPIIYTNIPYWNALPDTAQMAGTDLWIAEWGPTCPNLPRTWQSFRFWQHSDNGSVSGISGAVDLDRFDGSLDELRAYARGGAICPGAGEFCGADGVAGGSANTLYHCPGDGRAPSSSQACKNGCVVKPAGVPDVCR